MQRYATRLTLGTRATNQADSAAPALFLPECNRRLTAIDGLSTRPYDFVREISLSGINGKAPDDESPTRDAFTYRGSPQSTNLGFPALGGEVEFSIGIWLKSVQSQGNFVGIVHAEQTTSIRYGMLTGGSGLGNNNDVFLTIANGGNTYAYTTSEPLTPGRRRFLLWVFNGARLTDSERIRLFIDGDEEPLNNSGNIPATMPGPGQPLRVNDRGAAAAFGHFNVYDCFTILRDVSPLAQDLYADGEAGFLSLQKKPVYIPKEAGPAPPPPTDHALAFGINI